MMKIKKNHIAHVSHCLIIKWYYTGASLPRYVNAINETFARPSRLLTEIFRRAASHQDTESKMLISLKMMALPRQGKLI
jgi:hypothetical protein